MDRKQIQELQRIEDYLRRIKEDDYFEHIKKFIQETQVSILNTTFPPNELIMSEEKINIANWIMNNIVSIVSNGYGLIQQPYLKETTLRLDRLSELLDLLAQKGVFPVCIPEYDGYDIYFTFLHQVVPKLYSIFHRCKAGKMIASHPMVLDFIDRKVWNPKYNQEFMKRKFESDIEPLNKKVRIGGSRRRRSKSKRKTTKKRRTIKNFK